MLLARVATTRSGRHCILNRCRKSDAIAVCPWYWKSCRGIVSHALSAKSSTTPATSPVVATSDTGEQQAVTLINVSAVDPENQQALVDLLVQATDVVMSKQAG